jgi:hypothetical protein
MTEIALAVLTIVGTLGGVVLGSRLDHRRWLRDKRLEAYAAYDASINAWLLSFTHRDVQDLGSLTDPVRELTDKQQSVRLLAPKDTAEAAQRVLGIVLDAYVALAQKPTGADFTDAEEAAIAQAISEAGVALFALQVRDLNRRGLQR